MNDPYNLERFLAAQADVYDQVRSELRQGRKQSHWMWFIFPQIKGLGQSSTAVEYAIASKSEAAAYWRHSVLGPRLKECTELATAIDDASIETILGYPDHLKFRSSMTLFALATEDNAVFHSALQKYFEGQLDERTVNLMN